MGHLIWKAAFPKQVLFLPLKGVLNQSHEAVDWRQHASWYLFLPLAKSCRILLNLAESCLIIQNLAESCRILLDFEDLALYLPLDGVPSRSHDAVVWWQHASWHLFLPLAARQRLDVNEISALLEIRFAHGPCICYCHLVLEFPACIWTRLHTTINKTFPMSQYIY